MDRRTSKDQYGNLYVGHEKVTARVLFSTFGIYSPFFTLSQANDCAAFFRDLFHYDNLSTREICFQIDENNKNKSPRNFCGKILEMRLDNCKLFTCCRERDHVNRSLNIAHRKSDSYDISPCADVRLGMTSIVRSCFDEASAESGSIGKRRCTHLYKTRCDDFPLVLQNVRCAREIQRSYERRGRLQPVLPTFNLYFLYQRNYVSLLHVEVFRFQIDLFMFDNVLASRYISSQFCL